MPRRKIAQSTQTEVFVLSRRRCCVCYGLNHDAAVKKGQLAHLDGNPSNNVLDNLAYLCFDHHDELDTKPSQSKGLTVLEVRRYRNDLYEHFSGWASTVTPAHLLNFLASQITDDDIADAVVAVASTQYYYGPRHAHDVLTTQEFRAQTYELILPHLVVLDACASWGLLTYDQETTTDEAGMEETVLTVHFKPVCARLVAIIESKIKEKGEVNWDFPKGER